MSTTQIIRQQITLRFWDENGRPNILKTFTGSRLVGDETSGLRADDDSREWDAGAEWAVFQTAKGKVLVYATHTNARFAPEMKIYPSFEAARVAAHEDAIPANVLAEAAAALGESFEIELDI
jgi:hypothetical protein